MENNGQFNDELTKDELDIMAKILHDETIQVCHKSVVSTDKLLGDDLVVVNNTSKLNDKVMDSSSENVLEEAFQNLQRGKLTSETRSWFSRCQGFFQKNRVIVGLVVVALILGALDVHAGGLGFEIIVGELRYVANTIRALIKFLVYAPEVLKEEREMMLRTIGEIQEAIKQCKNCANAITTVVKTVTLFEGVEINTMLETTTVYLEAVDTMIPTPPAAISATDPGFVQTSITATATATRMAKSTMV